MPRIAPLTGLNLNRYCLQLKLSAQQRKVSRFGNRAFRYDQEGITRASGAWQSFAAISAPLLFDTKEERNQSFNSSFRSGSTSTEEDAPTRPSGMKGTAP